MTDHQEPTDPHQYDVRQRLGSKSEFHLQFRRRDVTVSVEAPKCPKEEKELWSAEARRGRVPFAKVFEIFRDQRETLDLLID